MSSNTFTIVPKADTAQTGSSWTKTPASNWWDNVNETGTADDTSYNQTGASGSFDCTVTAMQTALSVGTLTLLQRVKYLGGAGTRRARVYLITNATRYNGAWHDVTGATSETDFTDDWPTNPNTGGSWTAAQINALKIGWDFDEGADGESCRITQLKGYGTCVPLPADQDAVRDAASRRLFLRRSPTQLITLSGGPEMQDYAHHTALDVHHAMGVHEDGEGWLPKAWQRATLGVKDYSIDPMTGLVTTRLRNERMLRCWLYDSGHARQGGATKDGLMRFSNGATWNFTRASSATFTDAAGESVTVEDNVEAYAAKGQDFQPASGSRAADVGYWTNYDTGRTWPAECVSADFEVTPDWDGASAPTVKPTVAFITYPTSTHYFWIYYDRANLRWVFELRLTFVGFASYSAFISHVPVAGTTYRIGVRWSDYALPGNLWPSMSIFVDGVRGTDSGGVFGNLTEDTNSTFYIGSILGVSEWFAGKIRRRIVRPIVCTDDEMARSL